MESSLALPSLPVLQLPTSLSAAASFQGSENPGGDFSDASCLLTSKTCDLFTGNDGASLALCEMGSAGPKHRKESVQPV